MYYLWSTVASTRQIIATISKSGLLPTKVYVNNRLVDAGAKAIELKSGDNPILLKYNKTGRGYFVFGTGKAATIRPQTILLSTDWYLNPYVLPYNCSPGTKDSFGWYRFQSPPGARVMYVTSKSRPAVWIAGREYECQTGRLEAGRIADPDLKTWKPEKLIPRNPLRGMEPHNLKFPFFNPFLINDLIA